MLIYRKLFFGLLVVFVCIIFLLVQQRQMVQTEKEYVVRLQGQTRDALVRGDALEKQVASLKLELAKIKEQMDSDFDENAAKRYELRQACDRQMRKAEKKDSRARKR
jgi:hypothetical protein